MTRVFIAALTPAMRTGLRPLLDVPGFRIVGQASTLPDHEAELAGVDVIVVGDEELWGMAERVATSGGQALLALADDDRPVGAWRGRPLRGWGIVGRDVSAAELQAAVAAVAQGLIVLPVSVAERVLAQSTAVEPPALEPWEEPLTGREREVLELLSQGLSNREIARRLQISEHTAKFHVSSIYGKLGASSRTDAVTRGVRRGLITL